MATDMFFKINGVEGESPKKGHEKEIDVLAWSWGLSQTGTFHSGSGGGAGKANVQDLSFTKYVDKATTKLVNCCVSGDHFSEAVLTVRKAGGSDPLEYLKITLTNILVSSISTGGSGGEERLTENVSLNFQKFKIEYQTQKDDGTGEPAGNVGWDIAKNAKT
jgi:type VI secretion system secreted protein Hcp